GRKHDRRAPSRLLMSRPRVERKPDRIAAVRHVPTRHHHASRPTDGPVSTSPCKLVRLTLASNCDRLAFFPVAGVATSFPLTTERSTKVPSSTWTSAAKGLGMRRAKLLPHFCTCTRIGDNLRVSLRRRYKGELLRSIVADTLGRRMDSFAP